MVEPPRQENGQFVRRCKLIDFTHRSAHMWPICLVFLYCFLDSLRGLQGQSIRTASEQNGTFDRTWRVGTVPTEVGMYVRTYLCMYVCVRVYAYKASKAHGVIYSNRKSTHQTRISPTSTAFDPKHRHNTPLSTTVSPRSSSFGCRST